MPWGAAATIGGSIIGGVVSSKASKKAADASKYAADQNAAVNREIYTQTRQDLSPYNQAGQASLAALMSRLGLSAPSAATPPQTMPASAPSGGLTASDVAARRASSGPDGGPSGRQLAPDVLTTQQYMDRTGQTPISGDPRSAFAPTSASAATPGPDGQAYLAANPDVQAEFNRNMASGKGREYLAQIGADTPEGFAQWHYQQFGQNEGRQMPQTQPQTLPAPAGPAAGPTAPAQPEPGTELMTAQRPQAGPAPTFARPTDLQAPNLDSFFTNFEADPGYEFRLNEGLKGVNAASAARGKLRSGDAAMALQARADGLASQEYGNWFNRQMQRAQLANDAYRFAQGRDDLRFENDRTFGTDAYRWGVNRQDNIFDTDRGYQTSRYDQGISNLFGLVGVGQNAAAGTASAGNVFAQNMNNSNNQRAAATGNAAIANANNWSNMAGSAAQAVGTYYGLRGKGGSF